MCAKPRGFRFNATTKHILVKVVSCTETHIAPQGEVEAKWRGILEMLQASPEYQQYMSAKPTKAPQWYTMRGSFAAMIEKRREYNKEQSVATGEPETHGNFEKLLDSCIADMDAKAEKKRADGDERTKRDKGMQASVAR